MKRLILIAALFLSACSVEPTGAANTNNPQLRVVQLAQVDGCTIYRFYDVGRSHYFVRCGADVVTESTQSSGKTTYQEEIPTVPAGPKVLIRKP
jgi:hypothetical protein